MAFDADNCNGFREKETGARRWSDHREEIERKKGEGRKKEGVEEGDEGVEGLCYQKVPADRHRRQPREH